MSSCSSWVQSAQTRSEGEYNRKIQIRNTKYKYEKKKKNASSITYINKSLVQSVHRRSERGIQKRKTNMRNYEKKTDEFYYIYRSLVQEEY